MLLAVPNVSEGRDLATVEGLAASFSRGVKLLDTHSDAVHDRAVFTLAGGPERLRAALGSGAAAAAGSIDMRSYSGAHQAIGALDVCPLVWTAADDRESARAAAPEVADVIAREARVPVFLYGDLATNARRRERAYFRDGGPVELARRMATGELRPDFGPTAPHPTAGATLVTARPPLAAFNVVVEGVDLAETREIAAHVREAGGGLPGVRAIAIDLGRGRRQVSTNVHDPIDVPLARVVELVRALAAESGGEAVEAEIVGLVPEAALDGFPDDLPIPGFDPTGGVIERVA
jgi:glutamate formiminotransferase